MKDEISSLVRIQLLVKSTIKEISEKLPESKLLVKTVCFSEPSLRDSLSLPEVLADSFLDALFTP